MTPSIFEATSFHLDPVQLRAEAHSLGFEVDDLGAVHARAADGLRGEATTLPYAAEIQRSFGPDHDVSGIRAHVGGPAAEAAAAIGAAAYATGDHVAFASAPDLHTAAHEAAHVVQQRAGVQLYGGVGQAGDPYELQADAIADLVVAGQSAADLLAAGPGAAATPAVQRKGASQGELAGIATGALKVSKGVAQIAEATADLEIAKARAQRILAHWQSGKIETRRAAREVIHILGAAIEPIAELKAIVAHQAATPDAIRARDHRSREEAQALSANRPVIFDALTNIARVVLTIAASAADARSDAALALGAGPDALAASFAKLGEIDAMNRMLDSVAAVALPLGWSPPATIELANVARFAFEACPSGSADERPEHCALDDAGRVGAQLALHGACIDALDRFADAAKRLSSPLEQMIRADRKAQTAIADVVVGTIELAVDVAVPSIPGVGKLILGQVKDQLKDGLEGAMHAETVAGQGTVSMLEELKDAIKEALVTVQVSAKQLDDQSLLAATRKIKQLDQDAFAARLTPLVAAYGQQVDPIGRPRGIADELGLFGPPGTWDAVRVRLPTGALRAALVVRGERSDAKAGQPLLPPQYVPVYTFVRWIDAQFAPMVEDAKVVDYTGVNSLPLGEMLTL